MSNATKKRSNWKISDSITAFQVSLEHKEDFFKFKKIKQTDEFYKQQYFLDKLPEFEASSINNHVINIRRVYRKILQDLNSTGNNDGRKELNNSEELFNIVESYELEFYPRGSNVAPAVVLEPNKRTSFRATEEEDVDSAKAPRIDEPTNSKAVLRTRLEDILVKQETQINEMLKVLNEISNKLSGIIAILDN